MRSQFIFALLITLFFSGFYYYKTAGPCVVPQTYALGSIDPRFKLSTTTAEIIIAEATAVWEEVALRDLFVYDAQSSFKVNFIYDERQAKSDKANSQKEVLTEKEAESKKINEQYKALTGEYDALKKDYDTKAAEYQKRLNIFNATVTKYNEAGGAPEEVFLQLQKTETALKAEEKKLEAASTKLSAISQSINTLSAQGNAVISEYNKDVTQYNEKFSGGEEFTQGDYKGNAIDVYHFKDQNELKNVLVHEFGHAIGLPHVEGASSIMYYLMDKQPTTSKLSPEDLAALGLVCQSNESALQRFHTQFSALFIKLHLI